MLTDRGRHYARYFWPVLEDEGRVMPYLWPTDMSKLESCVTRWHPHRSEYHEWRLAYRDTESANQDHRYARYYCIYCLQQVARDLGAGLGPVDQAKSNATLRARYPDVARDAGI